MNNIKMKDFNNNYKINIRGIGTGSENVSVYEIDSGKEVLYMISMGSTEEEILEKVHYHLNVI